MEEGEYGALRTENTRLIALLDAHGIEWRLPQELTPKPISDVESVLKLHFVTQH